MEPQPVDAPTGFPQGQSPFWWIRRGERAARPPCLHFSSDTGHERAEPASDAGRDELDRGQARVGHRVGVQQVAELADAVGKPRRRARVVAVGVDGDARDTGARGRRRVPPPGRRRSRTGRRRRARARARARAPRSSRRTARPATPSTSWPRARSIISGSQCPAQNGGSIHSAKNTRGRWQPAVACATASIALHIEATISSPRGTAPNAEASVRTVAATSSSVRGSSEITSAPTGHADASSPLETAQTAHRSWVTITSGAQRLDQLRVDGVQRPPVAHRLADGAIDVGARERRRVDPRRRHHRLADHLGRPAALLRDADQRVDEPEVGDDLRCARQERADAHGPTVALGRSTPGPRCSPAPSRATPSTARAWSESCCRERVSGSLHALGLRDEQRFANALLGARQEPDVLIATRSRVRGRACSFRAPASMRSARVDLCDPAAARIAVEQGEGAVRRPARSWSAAT